VAGVLGLLITLLGFAGVMVLAQPRPEPAGATEAAGTPIGALAVPPLPVRVTRPAPALPRGKGMWLHYFRLAAGGDPAAMVAKAREVGLSHVFVRVGSSKDGFYAQSELDRLLPVAHAAGISVVGWDFPYLFDAEADAQRAATAIAYTTPDGHRMDAFSADIETRHEGVNISVPVADTYSRRLRELVGPTYPLIATVPRPRYNRGFPFAEIVRQFDAVAPMVYWLARDPAAEVEQAIADLAPLGKPVMPIGQAYDPGVDGGPPGPPSKEQVGRFIEAAQGRGATTWSFWVWHLATPDHWAAIGEARIPY
jgi:hypothetical protein